MSARTCSVYLHSAPFKLELLLLCREALTAVVGPGQGQPGQQSALEDSLSPESSHSSFEHAADRNSGKHHAMFCASAEHKAIIDCSLTGTIALC